MMRKPIRQTFGGKTGTGIWWRKRSLTSTTTTTTDNSSSSTSTPNDDDDDSDDLIVTSRRSCSGSSSRNNNNKQDTGSAVEETHDNEATAIVANGSTVVVTYSKAPRKKKRPLGTRSSGGKNRNNHNISDTDDEVLIEWDHALCRPIYTHLNQSRHEKECDTTKGGYLNDDDEENSDFDEQQQHHHHCCDDEDAKGRDDHDDGNPQMTKEDNDNIKTNDSAEGCVPPSVILVGLGNTLLSATTARRMRKRRTFADRPQRLVPSFLHLLQVEDSSARRSSSTTDEEDNDNSTPSPATNNNNKRLRKDGIVSSSSSPRHVSTISSETTATTALCNNFTSVTSSSTEYVTTKNRAEHHDDVFHFDGHDQDHTMISGIHQPTLSSSSSSLRTKRKTLSSSLQKQREYFDNLDRTQPSLTVDNTSSLSPTVSSTITRTTRTGWNLSSPRFRQEYQNYAMAVIDCGIPPLCMHDYATSRRLHFRKNELYDGFLDG
jgi:hypothetical protein